MHTNAGAAIMPRRNKIPQLLKERGLSISRLGVEARLPWTTTHKLATVDDIPDRTNIKTLESIARVLGVRVSELYELD